MAKFNAIELASEIVTSFVANNSVPRGELSALIETVHAAVTRLVEGGDVAAVAVDPPTPAVSIRKSITPDYLICLEDGKRFKSLRRHLAALGMTPEQYRAKWNLPSTYPMVAPNYAAQRSALAKDMGLGLLREKPVAAPPANLETIETVPSETAGGAESEAVSSPSENMGATEAAPPDPVGADAIEDVTESESVEATEAMAPEPASAPRRKARAKAKSEAVEAPPPAKPKRKPGRPRKTTA